VAHSPPASPLDPRGASSSPAAAHQRCAWGRCAQQQRPAAAALEPSPSPPPPYSDAKVANRDAKVLARRDRKGSLNDGQIQNPSNPFGIVPLSRFAPRGFGFVHHSIAILYHEVPNPNITIRNFFIAVYQCVGGVFPAPSSHRDAAVAAGHHGERGGHEQHAAHGKAHG
jgi:hypothetical protein